MDLTHRTMLIQTEAEDLAEVEVVLMEMEHQELKEILEAELDMEMMEVTQDQVADLVVAEAELEEMVLLETLQILAVLVERL